jgi:formiminoglutamase
MEIFDFFEPVNLDRIRDEGPIEEAAWYHAIAAFTGKPIDIANRKMVLIGIEDADGDNNASYEVRKYLYRLGRPEYAEHIADLGNFKFSYKDKAYETLGFVLSELISNNHLPIIINGGQEITFAQYLAFSYLKDYVNLVTFDARLDFNMKENKKIQSNNFLQRIFMSEPAYLFGFANVGFQSHFTDQTIVDFLENLYFDLHRLGEVRANMNDLEPLLRSSHFASWDLSAIKQSEAPGTLTPSPNGP